MTRSSLASRFCTLHQRVEQLSTLRAEEQHLNDRIARLEQVLDFDRVAAHTREAAERAELRTNPVPHLLMPDVLPREVYRVLLDAIPAPAFFEGNRADGEHLRVPLRLAPTHAIVTWSFMDELVRRSLSDVFVERFAKPLQAYVSERFPMAPPMTDCQSEITLIDGRIVRRTPSCAGAIHTDRSSAFMIGVLDLARDHDGEEYGTCLADVSNPFRANTALVCVGPSERLTYLAIPSHPRDGVERYTYEFAIGPTRQARRRLETATRAV